LQPGESVRAILNVRDLEEENKYIFFATRMGTVKKTPLKDFCNVMSRGIIAIGIEKHDELVAARVTDGNRIVFLASHEGMAIRFEEADVRPMGRPAYGVRGMHLEEKDYIVGMALTDPPGAKKTDGKEAEGEAKSAPSLILSVTENVDKSKGGRPPDVEYWVLIERVVDIFQLATGREVVIPSWNPNERIFSGDFFRLAELVDAAAASATQTQPRTNSALGNLLRQRQ